MPFSPAVLGLPQLGRGWPFSTPDLKSRAPFVFPRSEVCRGGPKRASILQPVPPGVQALETFQTVENSRWQAREFLCCTFQKIASLRETRRRILAGFARGLNRGRLRKPVRLLAGRCWKGAGGGQRHSEFATKANASRPMPRPRTHRRANPQPQASHLEGRPAVRSRAEQSAQARHFQKRSRTCDACPCQSGCRWLRLIGENWRMCRAYLCATVSGQKLGKCSCPPSGRVVLSPALSRILCSASGVWLVAKS